MNRALISIGSNINPEMNLDISRRLLIEHLGEVSFTGMIETQPYGKQYAGKFLNQLAVAYTTQSLEEVTAATKEIERLLGRLPEHKLQGIVKSDIDVFGWNGKIIRDEDYNRPYVQDLLPQLEELLRF